MVQAEWPECYDAASLTVKALQQRLEESKQCSKEKDNTVNKLRSRLHQLEEAVQNACRDVDEKEARMKKEHKMLQDVSSFLVPVYTDFISPKFYFPLSTQHILSKQALL